MRTQARDLEVAAPPVASEGSAELSNGWRAVSPVTVTPGIEVRELVGRAGRHKSNSYSVAYFTIAPGRTSATTYTQEAEETLIVLKGHGWLARGSQSEKISPGSVVVVPPRVSRSVAADSTEDLELVVVSSPAFHSRDSAPGYP